MRLHPCNLITSQRLHPWTPSPLGARISTYEISGGHKGWGHSRYKHELASFSSTGCLQPCSTASPSPWHHLAHIPYVLTTLGLTSSIRSSFNSTSCSAYLMFPPPILRPREPTRESRYDRLCKDSSPLLSGSSFLWPCWKRVEDDEMENLWHHWLTWCYCSCQEGLIWNSPEWQVFLLCGTPVIFQDICKLGIRHCIVVVFFDQGKYSGTPQLSHLQYSPQSVCFPHSASTLPEKSNWLQVSYLLADP